MAPESARWLTPDPPVKAPDLTFMSQPWDLHPYQYVAQNPVLYWDPDGRDRSVWCTGGFCSGMQPIPEGPPSEPSDPGYAKKTAESFEQVWEVVDCSSVGECALSLNPVGKARKIVSGLGKLLLKGKKGRKVHKGASKLDDAVEARKAAGAGEAAAERARNIKKGVPTKDLGPSGKPKIHGKKHASKKRAKDRAKQGAGRRGSTQ